jgi:predicted amidophosphoribosyltransferase
MFATLLDLVLPTRCVGCGSRTAPLCADCAPTSAPLVVMTGRLSTTAAAEYTGALRAALLAYKERGRRDLTAPLGALLGRALADAVPADPPARARVLLVPVPTTRAAAAARGGDHVLRLARRAAAARGLRVAPDALRLTRTPLDSAGLGVDERAANLDQAMRARAVPPGTAAVLVDDIVTTGATLREGARALAAAGWPVLGGAVVAATRRHSGGSSWRTGSPGPIGLA